MPRCPLCNVEISWKDRLDYDGSLVGRHFREAHPSYASDFLTKVLPLTYVSLGFLASTFVAMALVIQAISFEVIFFVEMIALLFLQSLYLVTRAKLMAKYRRPRS